MERHLLVLSEVLRRQKRGGAGESDECHRAHPVNKAEGGNSANPTTREGALGGFFN